MKNWSETEIARTRSIGLINQFKFHNIHGHSHNERNVMDGTNILIHNNIIVIMIVWSIINWRILSNRWLSNVFYARCALEHFTLCAPIDKYDTLGLYAQNTLNGSRLDWFFFCSLYAIIFINIVAIGLLASITIEALWYASGYKYIVK